jgi:hypothetical protein
MSKRLHGIKFREYGPVPDGQAARGSVCMNETFQKPSMTRPRSPSQVFGGLSSFLCQDVDLFTISELNLLVCQSLSLFHKSSHHSKSESASSLRHGVLGVLSTRAARGGGSTIEVELLDNFCGGRGGTIEISLGMQLFAVSVMHAVLQCASSQATIRTI